MHSKSDFSFKGAKTLVVADGSCPRVRELLIEAHAPVLWLEGIYPLETVSQALEERRSQGEPVEELHWVSHGRPGVLQVAGRDVDRDSLLKHQELLSDWRIETIALWSCNAGQCQNFTSLIEELTGATVWSSLQPLG